MAAQDLHEVIFDWPHPEPTTVIVTGTFDEWTCSVHLTKTPTGFVGSTKIPWGEKIKFKYVVDDKWLLHENQITEMDPGGFENHVYTAPQAPPATEEPSGNPAAESQADTAVQGETETPVADTANENGKNVTEDADEKVANVAEDEISAISEQVPDTSPRGLPQFLSNLANTIAARDGTTSALDYVASGLGVVIHNVVGVDPINNQQIAIPTPAADSAFTLPDGQETSLSSAALPTESDLDNTIGQAPETPPSPIAPMVPLVIVPVNAAENNTVALSPPEGASDAAIAPFIPGAVPFTVTDASASDKSEHSKGGVSIPEVVSVTTIADEITPVASQSDPAVDVTPEVLEKTVSLTHIDTPKSIDEPAVVTIAQDSSFKGTRVESSRIHSEPMFEEKGTTAETKVDDAVTSSAPAVEEAVVISLVEEPQQALGDVSDVTAVETKTEVEDATVVDYPAAATQLQKELASSTPEALLVADDSTVGGAGAVPTASENTGIDISANPPVENANSEVTGVPLNDSSEARTLVSAVVDVPSAEERVKEITTTDETEGNTVKDNSAETSLVETVQPKAEEAAPRVLVLAEAKVDEASAADVPANGDPAEVNPVMPAAGLATTKDSASEPISKLPTIQVLSLINKGDISETVLASIAVPAEAVGVASEEAVVTPSDSVVPAVDDSTAKQAATPVSYPVQETVNDTITKEPATSVEIPGESAGTASAQPVLAAERPADITQSKDKSAIASDTVQDTATKQPAEPSLETPALMPINGLVAPLKTDKSSSNGHSANATDSAAEAFPSTSSANDNSPSPAKGNTMRKKRTSIFGKLKHIFHNDKDKERK